MKKSFGYPIHAYIDFSACEAEVISEERAIFGRRQNLPADEFEIAFNFDIPFEDRMEQLSVLRTAKAIKRARRKAARLAHMSRPFEQRIGPADLLRARALGIKID